MGTREWRDYVTDVAFYQGPMSLQAEGDPLQVSGIPPTGIGLFAGS